MKKIICIIIFFFTIILIVPFIIFKVMNNTPSDEQNTTIMVYDTTKDKVIEMNKSQYLKEVVSAEMPAEFEIEALKAQAVAARTYLQNKIDSGDSPPEHKGACICTNSKHCKAWVSEADRKNKWDKAKSDEYWNKISKAVEETEGEVVMYQNKPITAVFHSTSSGKTESSLDVWGGDVPYLQSVDSSCDTLSPSYLSERSFAVDDYKNKISNNIENCDFNDTPYSNIIRSEAGGIISITVYGVKIKGTEFRNVFDLKSTNIEFSTADNNITMKVKGYGHGVGMSQYGAEYMAKQGNTYKQILSYYYTGTTIKQNNN